MTYEMFVQWNIDGMTCDARKAIKASQTSMSIYRGIWLVQWLQWKGKYEEAEQERLDLVRHLRLPAPVARKAIA